MHEQLDILDLTLPESEMTDYEWLTEMGLCHNCRKNKSAPGRKSCFDCLEWLRQYNAKRYDLQQQRQQYEKRKERYREKKEKGICVRCSKPATHGMYCIDHFVYYHKRGILRAEEAKRKRHERGLIPEYRKENGLCVRCGETLSEKDRNENYKMCLDCRKKQQEALKESRENHPWRKGERARYDKNRRWRGESRHADIQKAEQIG